VNDSIAQQFETAIQSSSAALTWSTCRYIYMVYIFMYICSKQRESMKGKQIVCRRTNKYEWQAKDNRNIMCHKGQGRRTHEEQQTEGKWQKDKATLTSSHRKINSNKDCSPIPDDGKKNTNYHLNYLRWNNSW